MVMGHPVNREVFYRNDSKVINNLSAFLMGEVLPSESDTFMHTSHYLAMLPTLRGALSKLAMLTLYLGKSLFLFAKETRISYLFSVGKSSERLQANVYSHLFRTLRQSLRLTLDRKGDIPFASSTSTNGTRFHLALERPMVDHLDTANLGKRHTVIMGGRLGHGDDTKATLREGEGIVSVLSLETREARFASSFSHSTEECLESQINAYGNILKYLRMNSIEGGTLLLQDREGVLLLKTGEGNTIAFIGRLMHLQQVVMAISS
jgi:hypothetical protein